MTLIDIWFVTVTYWGQKCKKKEKSVNQSTDAKKRADRIKKKKMFPVGDKTTSDSMSMTGSQAPFKIRPLMCYTWKQHLAKL